MIQSQLFCHMKSYCDTFVLYSTYPKLSNKIVKYFSQILKFYIKYCIYSHRRKEWRFLNAFLKSNLNEICILNLCLTLKQSCSPNYKIYSIKIS